SRRGILTAARIRDLIGKLDLRIKRSVLVLNRVSGEPEAAALKETGRYNLELGGTIPEDGEISKYDSEGRPTFCLSVSSPAVQAARQIFEKYIP
ncbi:MAG: hypothetical protein Q7J12_01840, partial [Syntrophales bacterium]|nr:hypothetical protein [Syntrophales bacterium]